jgi:formimidoylglutamate deiminase
MPNAHSHAFQRALRGRVERLAPDRTDDFWTWRSEMYAVVAELDPDSMRALATQAFSEMRAAGYGVVGEFHYVHHSSDGTPYAEPNAMAFAVAEAAGAAGQPIVMLPAAYHRNGWDGADRAPVAGQRRFCDPNVESFLERVDALRAWAASVEGVSVGVAAHSVRAVPASWLQAIASYARSRELVLHVHAHEQRRELDECFAEHGCSPIALLERTGFLSTRTSVVHGIHVSNDDVETLARAGCTVISCPTTEGNLGDGYLPAMAYSAAGVPLAIGSDSQTRIDPFEEARELETGSRRERQLRSGLLAACGGDLWGELCRNGHRSLGLHRAAGGDPAGGGPDPPSGSGLAMAAASISVDLDHPDLRGIDPADLRLAAVTCASAGVVVGR